VKRLLVFVLAAVALAGCVDPPPPSAPVTGAAPSAIGKEAPDEALFRSVRAYTVRLMKVGCDGVFAGSGIVVDRRTVVTNRHVVEGAQRVEVTTWDGDSLAVASVEQATGPDLAIVHLAQDAPTVAPGLAPHDPAVDQHLHLVGYADGKAPRMNNGVVERYLNDKQFDPSGRVVEMSGNVIPGNSGGPIVDDHGRIAGVVFGWEYRTGWVVGVPVARLRVLLHGVGRTPVVPC
jgi:S1-C subfamily serine protease